MAAPEGDDPALAELGIALAGPANDLVRRIHAERVRVVGFVPADDRVAVPPLVIHLGLALCDLSGATVAVVDANVRYPGLAQLNRDRERDHDD